MSQPKKNLNLIWIDLEMTGLNPDTDTIIEIATVVTDDKLNILGKAPVFAIKQKQKILDNMDAWNTKTHTKSGLIDRIKKEGVTLKYAEQKTLDFIKKFTPPNTSPLSGNSICQDRRFLFREMPELEKYLHYRNFDVSTLKELAKRFRPELIDGFAKKGTHSALDDILESIAEMKYYLNNLIKTE